MDLPPFLRLPIEMLTNITERLDLPDQVRLATTNRFLRSIIPPPTHEQFLQAERGTWAASKQLFTCRGCVSFQDRWNFTDDMRKGKRARRGPEAGTRLCIKCGVEKGHYSVGMEIAFKGGRAVLSRDRRKLTDHADTEEVCGAFGRLWICPLAPRRDVCQHHQDEWTHSRRYNAKGEYTEELYPYWADH
jgi:hypothetical protein